MELILKEHYFKLFAFRLKPVFIIQRVALYFGFIIAEKKGLKSKCGISFKKVMEHLCQIYNLIIKVVMH